MNHFAYGALPRVELGPRLHPVEPVALLGPEGAEALLGGGALVDARIGQEGVGHEILRRRERAVLAKEILDRLARDGVVAHVAVQLPSVRVWGAADSSLDGAGLEAAGSPVGICLWRYPTDNIAQSVVAK